MQGNGAYIYPRPFSIVVVTLAIICKAPSEKGNLVGTEFAIRVLLRMAQTMPQPQSLKDDAKFWTDLGMKYEAAFVDDPGLRRAVQYFLDLLPLPSQVLECGPGTGRPIAEMVAKSGRHIHGVDIAPGMVEICCKQVPEGSFEVANMLEFTPKTRYHGIIASLSIFELTREQITTMTQKWSSWLEPGGFLFITTFAAEDCTKQVKSEMYDSDRECARDVKWPFMNQINAITLFTRSGWTALLGRAGFDIYHTEDDLFEPAAGSGCDAEPRHYIIARKISRV